VSPLLKKRRRENMKTRTKFAGEFTNHYIGEVLSWKEYVTNLDLSHWSWVNCTPWEDRQVVEFVENKLYAVPVYPEDIYNDPQVSVFYLPNNLLAVSWDNFHYDVAVVKNEDADKPAGWLLVEEISDHEFKIAYGCGCPFETLEEVREFLEENKEDLLV
jgi:hypothetical protein